MTTARRGSGRRCSYPLSGGAARYFENPVDGAWLRIGFEADVYGSGSADVELAQ